MNNKQQEQFEDLFNTELKRLNPEQKEAVFSVDGPVMVVAGPGTGKTHILSARIGYILKETDTLSSNILCLTFTDAGAHAMRERLLQFIGPEAYKVHIYTFHSFCNKVIQENLELFGIQRLEPLNDLERVEIIRQLIDALPIDHSLKRGRRDIYFYEKHLHNLFKQMKQENWTEKFIHQKITKYLKDLPSRKEYIYQKKSGRFEKGQVKTGKLQKENEKMERLWAAAALFHQYNQLLRKNRRYDYEDMLLWVIREFERYEKLLRFYQEQYLYLMVDEFQDTSGAQNRILQLLVQYWENPNVFIVGDDDQSIYEFQGARLKNLIDFHQNYEQFVKVIFLKNNYRSTPSVLKTANALIQVNEKRISKELGLEKEIIACHPNYLHSTVQTKIWAFPNRMQEEAAILNKILELHNTGIPYEEMAVIYARHRQARNLIELLDKKEIPYHTKRKVNILDLPMIENLRLLLEYINLEYKGIYRGEHLLFQILHFDFFHISQEDLIKLSRHLAKKTGNSNWKDSINDLSLLKKLKLKKAESIFQLATLINDTIHQYRNLPLVLLIERLINRSGLLQHILSLPDQSWGLQVLGTFMNFLKTETDRNPRMSLDELLEIISRMDANYLTVGAQKTEQTWKGVNFVTAHSSKGLEFAAVFIIDAVKDYWEPGRSSPYQFTLPDTLTYSGEEDALEARRRLFYVAITRAKEHLYVSYSKAKNNGKILQRCQFIDEIISSYPIPVNDRSVPAKQLINTYKTILQESKAPEILPLRKAMVDELLKDFKISISSLNAYLRCPLSFFYEKVLKVPAITSEAAAYGTAIHYALMLLFEKMRRSKGKKFPALKTFLSYFNDEMKRNYSSFSPKEFKRRLDMGRANLSEIHHTFLPNWHKEILTELTVRNVEVQGVPLTGTIDKIEFYKDHAHIVDYKTGSQNPVKISSPGPTRPYGGIYWRQLVFYKILFESYRSEPKVKSGEIFFIDPDTSGKMNSNKINISEADVELIKELVRSTYQKIREHEFYTGCGESHCVWCNFVLKNITKDNFSVKSTELLDDGS